MFHIRFYPNYIVSMASCATRSECSCSSAACWRPCGCRRWWQMSTTVWQAGKWSTNWNQKIEFGTWKKHEARPSCVSCCSMDPAQSTHHVSCQKLSTRWTWTSHAQPVPSPLHQHPPSCAGQCSAEAPTRSEKAAGEWPGLSKERFAMSLHSTCKGRLVPCWRCPLRISA